MNPYLFYRQNTTTIYPTFWTPYPNFPVTDTHVPSSENLEEALKLIYEAIEDARQNRRFYRQLMRKAPTKAQKQIIKSIIDNKKAHIKIFRSIYHDLTGETLPKSTQPISVTKIPSFIDGLKQALFRELDSIEKYKKIYTALPTRYHRDLLFDIITDDFMHANKYNYLITSTLT